MRRKAERVRFCTVSKRSANLGRFIPVSSKEILALAPLNDSHKVSPHTLTPNALLCASSLLLLCLSPLSNARTLVCEGIQFLFLVCVPTIFARFGAAHYNTSRWAPEQPHHSPTSQTTSRSSGILNHVAYIPRVSNEPLARVGAYRGRPGSALSCSNAKSERYERHGMCVWRGGARVRAVDGKGEGGGEKEKRDVWESESQRVRRMCAPVCVCDTFQTEC